MLRACNFRLRFVAGSDVALFGCALGALVFGAPQLARRSGISSRKIVTSEGASIPRPTLPGFILTTCTEILAPGKTIFSCNFRVKTSMMRVSFPKGDLGQTDYSFFFAVCRPYLSRIAEKKAFGFS